MGYEINVIMFYEVEDLLELVFALADSLLHEVKSARNKVQFIDNFIEGLLDLRSQVLVTLS